LRTRTDTNGTFYADLPAAGRYHLRFAVDSTATFDVDSLVASDSRFVQREFIVALMPPAHVYLELQVQKQAYTMAGSPEPRYPMDMRADKIEGEVLRATHQGFVAAVRAALPFMRFSPAEIGGRRVPQMVQQPFTFELAP
jgi:hypothetical protein